MFVYKLSNIHIETRKEPAESRSLTAMKAMPNEIYLSVAQAADLLGISQEAIYKEICAKNLTPIENPDNTRKYPVVTHSELSRLYGNIYIPDGYLEYAGDRSVDFVRVALRQENERLRKKLEDIEKREQDLNDRLILALRNHQTLIQVHADLTKTLNSLTAVLSKIL
ncbi:hypothetical protein F4X88_04775 [Candidatus Poribacteria bacterium]|nr:hypothetical protein [Candidatus Poribacteria bacterium]MYA55591.1 hypothetical protein [Candidatus Poribacteria bacterium]